MKNAPNTLADPTSRHHGSTREVTLAFLKLGLTSFGGPIAHLGYFRTEFVARRRWIDDGGYADLVALCQFLPGPTSSQVGAALGFLRAGPWGALAAFAMFTLPSALFLVAFAYSAASFGGPLKDGAILGLKIVAVAIVAHAVLGMARSLCPDRERATIAVAAVLILALVPGAFGQVAAIATGAGAGLLWCRSDASPPTAPLNFGVTRAVGIGSLALFVALLVGLPLMASASDTLDVVDAFYRSGSLVFGGGHVVLPLLEAETVQTGWLSTDTFLAGYGAAQAVPGPLFSFAAYLGALLPSMLNGLVGSAVALLAIFLPGFLLLAGAMAFWDGLRSRPSAQAFMRGANAAVVGILATALYDPLFTSAIVDDLSFALGLTCFVLLVAWKVAPWLVVVLGALGGVLIAAL
ncbi:chromate efflux transporter [Aureimonas altamirensis]|uniref:chromate efflux transporter n=1 Tax=Aureimonas altamirensis TaxID=370622 RepID=UPI001E45D461|nr:chromate efflux transporter [Aureimonas altamirensis]UHD44721.1 chromate efflux transporter [Aureimonas altamirensis]